MIVVFGSINADLFVNVEKLPVRGETVLCPTYVFQPGGKGANQAVAAARAGADVRMIGCVGKDPYAVPVLDAIEASGVDVTGVDRTDSVTGTAMVMVEQGGENQIVVASGANLDVAADQVHDLMLTRGTTLVLQMEIPRKEIEAVIWRARQAGSRVILNLAPALAIDEAALRVCDVLIVNEGEAATLSKVTMGPVEQAAHLAQRYDLDCVVTLGGAGAVFTDGGATYRIGALDVDPVDTVGAGDAFVGVLSANLDAGLSMPDAVHRASVAGGLACLQEGAQTGLPTQTEIESVAPRLAPPEAVDRDYVTRPGGLIPETAMSVLYDGGLVFRPDGAAVAGHGVMVEGGRITSVAPSGEFDGYAGARVDTSGGTLLPGLVDCHVHLVYGGEADPSVVQGKLSDGQITIKALEHAQALLAGGITAVRDCGGKDYLEFAVRDACNQGRQLGPVIRAVGRMICMTGGHGNRIGRVADGIDDVIRAVREQIHAGSDQIKIMATGGVMTPGVNPEDAHYTAEEIGAGIAEGLRFNKKSASHAQGAEGILNAVRGGIASIEHGIFMTDECIDEMLARGTYLVPTLAAVMNIVRHKDQGIPAYVVEKAERVLEVHRESVRRFHAAGGKIAMGTDAGTPFNRHGENALELAYMTELDIAPADAILMSTVNGADLLDLDGYGRIEAGCIADMLVVDGNPVEDIAKVAEKSNHRLVVKDGRIVRDRDADNSPAAVISPFSSAESAGF